MPTLPKEVLNKIAMQRCTNCRRGRKTKQGLCSACRPQNNDRQNNKEEYGKIKQGYIGELGGFERYSTIQGGSERDQSDARRNRRRRRSPANRRIASS